MRDAAACAAPVVFEAVVDELVESSADDPELASALHWLDSEAQRRGVTFYDMVFEVLYRRDICMRAGRWMNARN